MFGATEGLKGQIQANMKHVSNLVVFNVPINENELKPWKQLSKEFSDASFLLYPRLDPDADLIYMAVVSGEPIRSSYGSCLSEPTQPDIRFGVPQHSEVDVTYRQPAETRSVKVLTSKMPA